MMVVRGDGHIDAFPQVSLAATRATLVQLRQERIESIGARND